MTLARQRREAQNPQFGALADWPSGQLSPSLRLRYAYIARRRFAPPSSLSADLRRPRRPHTTPGSPSFGSETEWSERQRGLEVGRRWTKRASAHELASIATASFDDLNQLLSPDVSDHFIRGFREAILYVWRDAPGSISNFSRQGRGDENGARFTRDHGPLPQRRAVTACWRRRSSRMPSTWPCSNSYPV